VTRNPARPAGAKDALAAKEHKDRKEKKQHKLLSLSSLRSFVAKILLDLHDPKSSPHGGNLPRGPREIWRFKDRANIENRGNREIREIRETGKLSGEGSGFFVCFACFTVQRIS